MDKTHSTTLTKCRLDQLVANSLSAAALLNSGEACSAEHQVRSTDASADSSTATAFVLDQVTTRDQPPSSIENIPVELFQGIVWEVVKESLSVLAYYSNITQMRLVCRGWTGVLEGMPEVWAKLSPCMDERLLDLALSRSIHCPLAITGWLLSSPALDKLLLHTYRWKHLDIRVGDPVQRFGPEVANRTYQRLWDQWAASALSNLHELILLDIEQGAPDVDTFLELLFHSPQLTRLRLRRTRLIRSALPQTRVSLSHLESLELEYLGQGIVKQLVESIDVPTSTRCWFSIALDDYAETSLYEQLEPISMRLATLANVSRGTRSTLTLIIKGAGWNFRVSYEGDADQHGTLTTDVEALPRSALDVFECFACQLGRSEPNPLPPVLRIVNLGYGDTSQNDSGLLKKLYDHLPDTDEIQIEDTSPRHIQIALNTLFQSEPSSRRFPCLSTLTIRGAGHEAWADWLLRGQKRQDKWRGVGPLPLETLKIEGGSLSAEKVEGLRKLVSNVVLDGVEVE